MHKQLQCQMLEQMHRSMHMHVLHQQPSMLYTGQTLWHLHTLSPDSSSVLPMGALTAVAHAARWQSKS